MSVVVVVFALQGRVYWRSGGCAGDGMQYVKDLLLTDTFLLKGHINTGGQRLSSYLNTLPKGFLEMEEVKIVTLVHEERFTVPRMFVRVEEIILAHEMEDTGDEALRLLAGQDRDEIDIVVRFGGFPVQLSGKVSQRVIEREASGQHDFIVVVKPKLHGVPDKWAEECGLFENLPYVIANRRRLAFVVDLSGNP